MKNNWIPVSERLPKVPYKDGVSENVLVFTSLNRTAVTSYDSETDSEHWHGYHMRKDEYVTHWQPLPPAPDIEPIEPKPDKPRLTAEEWIGRMVDLMPFSLNPNIRPYILEALRAFARQEIEDREWKDEIKDLHQKRNA